MLSTSQITIGSTYNFEMYAPAILGTAYKNVKVVAILDADSAQAYINPVLMHRNVYPHLPAGVPNQYNGYSYLKLKLASGKYTAVGIPWIRDETFTEIATTSLRFTIQNVSPDDRNTIMKALSANGFSAVDVQEIASS